MPRLPGLTARVRRGLQQLIGRARPLWTKVRNRLGRTAAWRWRLAGAPSPTRAIVIGGCPRSGTTLLRHLLDGHPGLCCGPESSLLLPGRPDVAALASAYEMPVALVARMLRSSRSQTSFVDRFFARVAKRRGKARWAEKTPLNVAQLPWIWRHFPETRFIHVIRDGRDVICSLRSHPLRRFVDGQWVQVPQKRSLDSVISAWLNLTAAGLKYRGDQRYLEVRYEDLVANPETEMRRVLEFVGEPFDPAWLAARLQAKSEGEPGAGKPASGAITSSSIGRWRRDLEPAELARVRELLSDRLLELGYVTARDWS